MILSSSTPIQKLLHFSFQNHRKSTLQRIKIDIDVSIDLFIDFYSTWTPFWEALGRRLGPSWEQKTGDRFLSSASELSLCIFFALLHLLTLFWAQYTPIWSSKILPKRSQRIKILPNTSIVVCYASSYAFIILTFHHTSKTKV